MEPNIEEKLLRANTAVDFTKQSPYMMENNNAERIISIELGLPLGPKEVLHVKKDREGFFLPLDYYNLDESDVDPI